MKTVCLSINIQFIKGITNLGKAKIAIGYFACTHLSTMPKLFKFRFFPLNNLAFSPLSNQMSLAEVPLDKVKEGWFRMLHLFGNPVDLCHPGVITHTAVFEQHQ